MSNKGQLLQDPFLNALRREHVPVSIYLVNGIKLQGQIESFDQYVVLLRWSTSTRFLRSSQVEPSIFLLQKPLMPTAATLELLPSGGTRFLSEAGRKEGGGL